MFAAPSLTDSQKEEPMPKPTCSIEGCDNPAWCRGWCTSHYGSWRHHGDPLIRKQVSPGVPLQFLMTALLFRDRSECWPWPFSKISQERPYGKLRFEGQTQLLSHVVLVLTGDPRPPVPNDHALHSCDNPPCFNPAHLRWGTQLDNVDDMVARGRVARGERKSKLTEADIRLIRNDTRTQERIAQDYPVGRRAIAHIQHRDRWAHVI